MSSLCPLTGLPGVPLRTRTGDQLFDAYAQYFQRQLPMAFKKYFTGTITEYFRLESGLRWYSPCQLGESEFYAVLGELFPWYYQQESWDKRETLKQVSLSHPAQVVEIGCGEGWLLNEIKRRNGCSVSGIDLNKEAINRARQKGLNVFLPTDLGEIEGPTDMLIMLQTVEHLAEPVGMLRQYIERLQPRTLLLSGPTFTGLLGRLSDPLVWPPHHYTAWSLRAFRILGSELGYGVTQASYEPLSFGRFQEAKQREGGKIPGILSLPGGRFGKLTFRALQLMGLRWATRAHSIFVKMEKML